MRKEEFPVRNRTTCHRKSFIPSLFDNPHEDPMSLEKKNEERFPLQRDAYAFISVAPVSIVPFLFSCGVILLEFVVHAILAADLDLNKLGIERLSTLIVKFFSYPRSYCDAKGSHRCLLVLCQCPVLPVESTRKCGRYQNKAVWVSVSSLCLRRVQHCPFF